MEEIYLELDKELSEFTQRSGLHCKTGCGRCCLKPDVEATPLEFIPFAYHLHKQGKAIEWLENPDLNNSVCAILDPNRIGLGHCTSYETRALICRLFGFSARLNKYGSRELMSCQVIKGEQPEEFLVAQALTLAGGQVPLMKDYYMRLQSIDWDLGAKFYPINVAIKMALETVLHYYAYRDDLSVTKS